MMQYKKLYLRCTNMLNELTQPSENQPSSHSKFATSMLYIFSWKRYTESIFTELVE